MLPQWIRTTVPSGGYRRIESVRRVLEKYRLNTVCTSALCPNVFECWGMGTATFMILGDTCTRACRFCAVRTGNPRGRVDTSEPERVAAAVAELGLDYVVITSVDRDDLPDGGAAIFAETVRRIKEASPRTLVEVLVPDFGGKEESVRAVVEARPDVFAHNIETVRRLTPLVRDRRASYDKSLHVLRLAKELGAPLTKSSLIVGFGEEKEELVEALRDLRGVGVDIVTIGQYIRPTSSARHLPVARWVPPEEFRELEEVALGMGFKAVASGPLVRSSYRAIETYIKSFVSNQI